MRTNKSKLPDGGIATHAGKHEVDLGFLALVRCTLREPGIEEITSEVLKRLRTAMKQADRINRRRIDG